MQGDLLLLNILLHALKKRNRNIHNVKKIYIYYSLCVSAFFYTILYRTYFIFQGTSPL